MKALSKTLIAAAVSATALFATTASAATFNPFTVQPEGSRAAFVADKITGNYNERATFNDDGTFDVSLVWSAGQFVSDGGTQPVRGTGLTNDYGIYALYKASGTFLTVGGLTTFTFAPGSGLLSLYLDRNNDTNYSLPTLGGDDIIVTSNGDDMLLGSGNPLTGTGELNPTLPTCGVASGINCGSFGASNTFSLTDFGKTFFVAPDPFYTLTFQSGQLNNFAPGGNQNVNGSLDVVFAEPGEVPEPASVGLLGLGLLGLAAARRRAKKSA